MTNRNIEHHIINNFTPFITSLIIVIVIIIVQPNLIKKYSIRFNFLNKSSANLSMNYLQSCNFCWHLNKYSLGDLDYGMNPQDMIGNSDPTISTSKCTGICCWPTLGLPDIRYPNIYSGIQRKQGHHSKCTSSRQLRHMSQLDTDSIYRPFSLHSLSCKYKLLKLLNTLIRIHIHSHQCSRHFETKTQGHKHSFY